MPEPLTFLGAMDNAIAFMFAGWVAYVPIWVIAKFSLM